MARAFGMKEKLSTRSPDTNTQMETGRSREEVGGMDFPYTTATKPQISNLIAEWERNGNMCPHPHCHRLTKKNIKVKALTTTEKLKEHYLHYHMKKGNELKFPCSYKRNKKACKMVFRYKRDMQCHIVRVHNVKTKQATAMIKKVEKQWWHHVHGGCSLDQEAEDSNHKVAVEITSKENTPCYKCSSGKCHSAGCEGTEDSTQMNMENSEMEHGQNKHNSAQIQESLSADDSSESFSSGDLHIKDHVQNENNSPNENHTDMTSEIDEPLYSATDTINEEMTPRKKADDQTNRMAQTRTVEKRPEADTAQKNAVSFLSQTCVPKNLEMDLANANSQLLKSTSIMADLIAQNSQLRAELKLIAKEKKQNQKDPKDELCVVILKKSQLDLIKSTLISLQRHVSLESIPRGLRSYLPTEADQ